MKIEGPLLWGKFVERPNRFITLVELDGKIIPSHLPDPGRLKELLVPGADLLLRMAPQGSERKTEYSTIMVCHDGQLISLVSTLPNRFVLESINSKGLPMFSDYEIVRTEVAHGNHRFDFLLKDQKGNPFYLEVKSVTFVEERLAKFPDAVTERGARHAQALREIVEEGGSAGILFVCQRSDADHFAPMWNRDPKFSNALLQSHLAGVKVWCITTQVSETEMKFGQEIPVNLIPPQP